MMRVGLLLALLWSALATAPGAKVTLSQAGLTYAKDIGVQMLLQQLKSVSIPNQSGTESTPIGDISYDLSNIVLHSLAIPSSEITIVSSVGLRVEALTVSCDVDMNWSYREDAWPHVSDSGSATASISQMNIISEVAVGEQNGRPTVHAVSTSVSIGQFSITLHGGASWLYNLFIGWFNGSIKDSVQSTMVGAINQAINQQAEQALATLPVETAVDRFALIDFELVQTPAFDSSSLTTQHLAEFFERHDPHSQPWNPTVLPDSAFSDMVTILLSEAVADSAGFVYYDVGFLQANVTQFPASVGFPLNTTSFQPLIPGLYKAFPNTPMMLHAAANDTPFFDVSTAGGLVHGTGLLNFYVLPHGHSPQIAFTLGIAVVLKGEVGVTKQNITGTVTFLSAQLSVEYSPYGPFDVSELQQLIDQLCQSGLVPWLNERLGLGFPLPVVDGVSFQNIKVYYGNGYVQIGSDFTYTPSVLDV